MPQNRSIVQLPQGAQPPYRVFLNGVPQEEGRDYRVEGDTLVFPKHLQKEGRLGALRWAGIFLGLFGIWRGRWRRARTAAGFLASSRGPEHVAPPSETTAALGAVPILKPSGCADEL